MNQTQKLDPVVKIFGKDGLVCLGVFAQVDGDHGPFSIHVLAPADCLPREHVIEVEINGKRVNSQVAGYLSGNRLARLSLYVLGFPEQLLRYTGICPRERRTERKATALLGNAGSTKRETGIVVGEREENPELLTCRFDSFLPLGTPILFGGTFSGGAIVTGKATSEGKEVVTASIPVLPPPGEPEPSRPAESTRHMLPRMGFVPAQ